MSIIKPRLVDYYNIPITQEDVDFVIPLLEDDIPLYVDPFLLWKSPSLQDNSLHASLINSFNHLGYLCKNGDTAKACNILKEASECSEVGLGESKNKIGHKIGEKIANEVLSLFINIPQLSNGGFLHFEAIQLYIDGISKDRISDFSCTFLKSFLIDFTIENCEKYGIPMEKASKTRVYDHKLYNFSEEDIYLPHNPENKKPIIFIPKRWLRHIPWINYDDYFKSYYIKNIDDKIDKGELGRIKILNYNRQNYDVVKNYIQTREREQTDCKNDPLFKQIPILSAKRQLSDLKKLPCGKENNSDKKYEDIIVKLLSSILYPHLDFADAQSRIESGSQIRDLIFYNNRSYPFLQEIYDTYSSKQIVMEIKNVTKIEREHINQLNRYMTDNFGRFGVIVTRNKLATPMQKNIIDLWAGQRRCIIALTDEDVDMMVNLFESKQRLPIEVLKMKYIQFMRACPA